MKKSLLTIAGLLVLAGAGMYVFQEQLWQFTKDKITADMFVEADTDNFDPGLPIGSRFPAIKAMYQGREISDLSQFVHDKGMVFIANRSADW